MVAALKHIDLISADFKFRMFRSKYPLFCTVLVTWIEKKKNTNRNKKHHQEIQKNLFIYIK